MRRGSEKEDELVNGKHVRERSYRWHSRSWYATGKSVNGQGNSRIGVFLGRPLTRTVLGAKDVKGCQVERRKGKCSSKEVAREWDEVGELTQGVSRTGQESRLP